LESLGLMPSIREMMRICRDAGMAASVSCCKALQKFGLPADVEIALFRIAQEAVNNAVRHSRARKVKLELDYNDGYVRLSVVDDGVGFDVAGAGGRGLGLNSMKERAEAIGGILEIISRKSGTRVKIRAPAKLLKQRP
jgi:signal transduction histidine kinase